MTTGDSTGRASPHSQAHEAQASVARDAAFLQAAKSRRLRHVLVLFAVGILWGIQPALIKGSTRGGLREIEALALVLGCVAAVVGLYLAARGRLFRPTREKVVFSAVSGGAEYAAPLSIAFLVAPHIDSGLLTLILSTTPVFTVILNAMIGAEPLTRSNVLACLLGLAAMALIVVPSGALPSPDMLPWCVAAFAIPAIYACGSTYVARAWPADMDAIQVAFAGSIAATLFLAPFSIQALVSGSAFADSTIIYLAIAGLITALVLEMNLYFFLLKEAGAVFTSFSSFVMILSGFIAGAVFFDEQPSLWVWASVALFSLSLALIIAAKRTTDARGH